MFPKKVIEQKQLMEMIEFYNQTLSVFKTAKKFNVGINRTRKELKKAGVLLTLSELASLRIGKKNHFYGKNHSENTKKNHSEFMKTRLGKLNPNYKNGKYIRRPRDFKIAEFKPIRNFVFNRDKYTCQLTGQKGGHLHAHHLIPYWVCPEAFLDTENLITVSTKAHFEICHNGDWAKFNANIIPDKLLQKYSIQRERLNELASFYIKKDEAIVRPSAI